MNWTRALVAGVVGGIAMNVSDFIQHGLILGNTYTKYPIFTKTQAPPYLFTEVAVLIGIFAAFLFAKTRSSWPDGVKGGLLFGFFLGLVSFFAPFYNVLVLEGFPYHLCWCWGGINLSGFMIFGAVAGAIYKTA